MHSCLHFFPKNAEATVRLFCFHHAGGNANVFYNWSQFLPENIELAAIQLPGRMSLCGTKAYTDLDSIINYLHSHLLPYLMEKPFIFFGHSLGGLISFELARFLQAHHGPAPIKLISSACKSPRKPRGLKKISTFSESALIDELITYDYTPRELLENKELMQIALPIIRSDFAVNEGYSYFPGQLLNCPITSYGGIDDLTLQQNELDDWRNETTGAFTLQMFSGDHFFVFKQRDMFLRHLAYELIKSSEF